MSQPQPPSSSEPPAAQAPAPATEPAPDAGRFYTSAEQRASILARTGASDLGAFHPAAPAPAASTPAPTETQQPAETAAPAPTAPAPTALPPSDVAAELAAMRAEVAALQARTKEPEAAAPEPPAAPAHPLEAHARNVLGPGAQPHHVQRAVTMLEEGMRWKAVLEHHAKHPSDAAPAAKEQAQRALDEIQRQVQDLAELATLHAQLGELRAQQQAPKPEQRMQERSQTLDKVLADATHMGAHHPNLTRAMAANPAVREQARAYLMALPDDEHFAARGDAYLHNLDAMFATAPVAAPQPTQPPPAAAKETNVPKLPQTAPPPAQPTGGPRYPVTATSNGTEQPFVSRKDFWDRVNNGFAARGRA